MKRRRHFLCLFAHRWRDVTGDTTGDLKSGVAYEQCRRCGMFRSSMAAWDGAYWSKPYFVDPRQGTEDLRHY